MTEFCAFRCPAKISMSINKCEIARNSLVRKLTNMVSVVRLLCSASNECVKATPSKSSNKMRIRVSVPYCAKCNPSNEYQCSNSAGELIASHILISSSMNCNFAVFRHAPFVLQNYYNIIDCLVVMGIDDNKMIADNLQVCEVARGWLKCMWCGLNWSKWKWFNTFWWIVRLWWDAIANNWIATIQCDPEERRRK